VDAAVLPVAAAATVTDLLTGPPRPARVALVGRLAAYLVLDDGPDGPRPPRVLAVVCPDALVPPSALVLSRGHDPRRLLAPADAVTVGAGGVRTPRARLVVRRWWTPAVLPTGAPDPAAVARVGQLLDGARTALRVPPGTGRRQALAAALPAARALAAGDGAAAARWLLPVLGLGPGTTPTGDDVAAGVLLGALATRTDPAAVDQLAGALLAAAPERTTAVSAGLLAEAAAGRAPQPVLLAVRALLGGADPDDAVAQLLAVGHTSGADLATGLHAAALARLSLSVSHPVVRPSRRSA
jgi:hypothetical protein